MATKRMLYKPAQSKVGKRTNRRPLAQGRLVTSAPNVPTGPRLAQGEVNESKASIASAYSSRDDPNATPRRAVPRATEENSPLPSPPAPTLDLSDNEEVQDPRHTPPRQVGSTPQARTPQPVHHFSHIMVLDASASNISPDRTDVDCVIGYEKSPATVICHNTSGSPKNARDRVEEAKPRAEEGGRTWQIPVSQVPRVNTSSPAGAFSPLMASGVGSIRVANKDKASSTTRDQPVFSSTARRRQDSSAKTSQTEQKVPQPNFEESGESEKANSGVAGENAVGRATGAASDSDTCSLLEYVPQISSRPKESASSDKPPVKPPKSEKKKKGERIIPSRYMQSAKSKKPSNSSLSDKSSGTRRGLNLGRSGSNSGTSVTSAGRKKSPSRMRVPQGKTSTPTHDDAPIMTSCDASAINPELSVLSAIDASHLKLPTSGSSGYYSGSGSPLKQAKKVDPRIQQQRLDLCYARYLQWLFLDTKAKNRLQQQEKHAMRQLHALWQMEEEKRQRKAELNLEVARLRHLNHLDSQLEKQHRGLQLVDDLLPTLQKDYLQLAKALDTTRHQIQTHGIHMPQDEDFFLASLEQILEESEQLLGNLALRTKEKVPSVTDLANAVTAVEKAVDAECLELYRCGELLSAMQSLTTHQNSLLIQAMQASK